MPISSCMNALIQIYLLLLIPVLKSKTLQLQEFITAGRGGACAKAWRCTRKCSVWREFITALKQVKDMENALTKIPPSSPAPTPPPLPLSPTHATPQCPELDLSLTLTPERPGRPAGALDKDKTQTCPHQVRFAASPDSSSGQHPVTMAMTQHYSNQSAAEKHHSKGKQGSHTEEQVGVSGQLLDGLGLNTTLALKAELQQLEETEFNCQKALQERLQNSTTAQECIRTRATEGLNFPRSHHLYRALVSVSLSHDELVAEALRDRPALAPPTSTYRTKSRPPPAEGPDLLFFFDSSCVVRETPLLPGNHIPVPHLRPAPRPAHMTFHLLQRHRHWEA